MFGVSISNPYTTTTRVSSFLLWLPWWAWTKTEREEEEEEADLGRWEEYTKPGQERSCWRLFKCHFHPGSEQQASGSFSTLPWILWAHRNDRFSQASSLSVDCVREYHPVSGSASVVTLILLFYFILLHFFRLRHTTGRSHYEEAWMATNIYKAGEKICSLMVKFFGGKVQYIVRPQ